MKDHHLADELGLPPNQRGTLRNILRELAMDGKMRKMNGNRWAPSLPPVDRLTGSVSVSPQGHGMVRVRGGIGNDAEIFIPPGDLGGALHGDEVEVEKTQMTGSRSRRPALPGDLRMRPNGRVVRIIERRKNVVVGLLMKSDTYWYVIPDHPRINQNVRVVPNKLSKMAPPSGYKVVVKLDGNLSSEMLHGEVIEILGAPNAPGVDVLSILREHEIATGFSDKTQEEARSREKEPSEKDRAGRLDLREEIIITIDPSDAKDHDDAVSLRRLENGGWILGVHIADVSHFVTPGSAIDRDAREHGNSVYMVDRFIPMLPPYLTSEVCSLKAGRDRLAYSVFITYDEDANVTQVEMGESVIHPKILLDYEKVQGLISGGAGDDVPREYHSLLHDMHQLASLLRKQRMSHGAIDLSMPEVTCKLDDEGRPISLKRRSSPEAYHLIEEFMLAGNVAVADRLDDAKIPAIYRIHEYPSDDQWQQMGMDLQQLGIDASPTDRHDMQIISRKYAKEPLGYPVSIALLRNLKRAIYSADCSPHFGLAFDRYTHFTSPIRRYSDLIVHRVLKSLDAGHGGMYSRIECDEVAAHCSRREREASEAEEESLIIKRIQYYEYLLEKGETGPWPALITGGTTRGLLVEIVETLQRGFVPNFALPDPDITIDRETGMLNGRKGRSFARIGEVIPVELMRVDRNRRSIELRWLAQGSSDRTTTPGKKRGRAAEESASKKTHRGEKRRQRKR